MMVEWIRIAIVLLIFWIMANDNGIDYHTPYIVAAALVAMWKRKGE